MKPRTPPLAKIPPTADDIWQDQTNEKCARAMALWLKGSINTQRPINTLKLEEMKAMAQTVISEFIVEASHRVRADVSDEERQRIAAILT